MSQKELKRLKIVQEVQAGRLRQIEAANVLRISVRHLRRLVARFAEEGEIGMVHRSRGKPAVNKICEKDIERILKLAGDKYHGFGPTLFHEKLEEYEGIKVSRETLRKLFLSEGCEYRRRRKRAHKKWRARKKNKGEMVQLDGSHHDWFEGRGPEVVLMGYIDDATGEVFARFYEYEGTIPALDSFRRYVSKHGIPANVYLDRHTTYKSPAKATIEDELKGREPQSTFERALSELGCHVIHAYSPQAKGRIERLFGTFQDRMIKEMRLTGISSIEEANLFLEKYLPKYNRRFRRHPAEKADLHRTAPGYQELLKTLCIREERKVKNDSTFSYKGKRYLITNRVYAKKVMIEERLDGRMVVRSKAKEFKYKEIPLDKRVEKAPRVIPEASRKRMSEKPSWMPHRLANKKAFEKSVNP